MRIRTFFTGLFILCTINAFSQGSSKYGLVVGPGIANDIHNLGLKFEPSVAIKAGVFMIRPVNDRRSIYGELGYVKTGFKDRIYYSLPGGTSFGRKNYYSMRYHKLYATLGFKMPVSKKNERIYFNPGLSVHYLLSHELVNEESNMSLHYKQYIEDYRSVQLYANIETSYTISDFTMGVVFSPQIVNNASGKGNLRAYSYYTGLSLKMPFLYFR